MFCFAADVKGNRSRLSGYTTASWRDKGVSGRCVQAPLPPTCRRIAQLQQEDMG